MGAGKSTIGRNLARTLNLEFLDSDHVIEERTGVDIPLIFELEGEDGFRKRESAIIDELTARSQIILATGGGAILDPDNRSKLSSRGIVIYLETSVEQQLRRTSHDHSRPLLQTEDPKTKLQELMRIRGPLYAEVADWTIKTDHRKSRDVVLRITEKIKQRL